MKKGVFSYIVLAFFSAFCCFAGNDSMRNSLSDMMAGVEAYINKDMAKAAEYLGKALEENEANDAAHYYMGFVAAATNDAKTMLEHFEAAYSLDTANVWYAKRLAAAYSVLQRPEDAQKLYQSLLRKHPGDSEILSEVVDFHIMQGEYDKADSLLAGIDALHGPTDYSILSRLEILRMQGKYADFFKGLNKYFSDVEVPAGEKTKMISDLLRNGNPHFNYSHRSDYDTLVETCICTHPADTAALHFAGDYYYSTDQHDKLLALYKNNSFDTRLTLQATYVYIGREDFKTALECCRELEPRFSGNKGSLASLYATEADCYQFMGKTSSAIKAYEAALKVDPDNIVAMNNYAYFLSCRGKKLSKCEKLSRKTIEAEPENATYLDTYAWILYKMKRYEEAKSYFKKVMTYGGKSSAEVLEHYAATLEALGEKDLAEGYRQQAKLKRDAGKK